MFNRLLLCIRSLLYVVIVTILSGMSSFDVNAGVYDDVKAWWHFDYDANSNGVAEVGEIRDQLDWGTTASPGASGFHADYTYGSVSGAPGWTNDVVSPAHGNTYGGMSMNFRAPTNGVGECWPDVFYITDPNLLVHYSATIVSRFRWEGYPNSSEQTVAWLYNNGLFYTDYQGWMFGVTGSTPHLGILAGRTFQNMSTVTITPGVWYEAAAVFTDNGENDTIEFYLWKEGDVLRYQKLNSSAVTNANSGTGIRVGSETYTSDYSGGNAYKTFRGAANHIAVWDRALSSNEIYEAFCYSQQPLVQVGIKNASDHELRYENEANEAYYPGDPWHTMARAVKAGRDAVIKIPMNAADTSVDYSLYLNTYGTDDVNSTADISLIVNTATNKIHTLGRNEEVYWFIPKEQLISGTNTFALHYHNGTSAFLTFDSLELGGSWQVGYDDNSQGEFIIEGSAPVDYYVTDPDWMHLKRAITSYGNPKINIHFALSSHMLSRYLYSYTTRVVSQSGPGTHAFSIGVNGTNIHSSPGVANNTLVSVPIPSTLLNEGMNEINLTYDDTTPSSYMQFDFHRLELKRHGTLIILY